MASSPAGIAGVFDRAADTYDAVGVPWFGPIAAGLVEELAVRPGERVLDIGCGRGAALVPLAHATGPGGHVLGIDLAPRMVERTTADVQDLLHVEVRVGDASEPAVPPASYDVVAAEFADPQQWLDFSWSHGQRAMWEAVPAEAHDDVRRRIVQLLEGFAPLAFTQVVRHTLARRPG